MSNYNSQIRGESWKSEKRDKKERENLREKKERVRKDGGRDR